MGVRGRRSNATLIKGIVKDVLKLNEKIGFYRPVV